MESQTLDIQTALKAQGYDPGPLDGAMGPLTRAAIKSFERKAGLPADGAPDPAFVRRLLGDTTKPIYLPWFDEALRRKGLHESRDKTELANFLKSDKRSVGDPTKLPWCGDFVETCIALALPGEPLPVNPYLARNWLTFGIPREPSLGAVLVFWRGSKTGTQGHVGFYAGEDAEAFHVLGGNQSDSVSVARVAKARLLGARWPKSVPLSGVNKVVSDGTGGLSTNEA